MKSEKIKKFFSSRSGRSVVIVTAVLLIGLAVYLNYRWFYDPIDSMGYGDNNMENGFADNEQTSGDGEGEGEAENNYFTAVSLTRQQSRDEAIDVLNTIIESSESSEEAKAEAAAEISKIAVNIQNESNIETLVKAKGFEECVAVIGDDYVSVIVKSEGLVANQAAQILSIVCETTGVLPQNVSIINK